MTDPDLSIRARTVPDFEALRLRLEGPSVFKESWPDDNAGTNKFRARHLAHQQLSIVLRYLNGWVNSEAIAPLVALRDELTNLDHGYEAGPITSPVGKKELRLREAWTKAVVTAIVDHAMDGGSKMAPVLERIRIKTGIEIKEGDVKNWRGDGRDFIASAVKRNQFDECDVRGFNYFEYINAKSALESKTQSEALFLVLLKLGGIVPRRRAERSDKKT